MGRSGFTSGSYPVALEYDPRTEGVRWQLDADGDGVYEDDRTFGNFRMGRSADTVKREVFVVDLTEQSRVIVSWSTSATSKGYRLLMGQAAAALPVELTAFTARAAGANNLLEWTTNSEQDNEGFVVERSADGTAFIDIGMVAGAGTTAATTDYRYLDRAPLPAAYYRLRQQDFDGTVSYSRLVHVERAGADGAASMLLFPNPASGHINLRTDRAGHVRLVHSSGRVMHEQRVDAGTTPLSLRSWPGGTYWVEFTSGGERQRLKFIAY
jgi:hypothetical protein